MALIPESVGPVPGIPVGVFLSILAQVRPSTLPAIDEGLDFVGLLREWADLVAGTQDAHEYTAQALATIRGWLEGFMSEEDVQRYGQMDEALRICWDPEQEFSWQAMVSIAVHCLFLCSMARQSAPKLDEPETDAFILRVRSVAEKALHWFLACGVVYLAAMLDKTGEKEPFAKGKVLSLEAWALLASLFASEESSAWAAEQYKVLASRVLTPEEGRLDFHIGLGYVLASAALGHDVEAMDNLTLLAGKEKHGSGAEISWSDFPDLAEAKHFIAYHVQSWYGPPTKEEDYPKILFLITQAARAGRFDGLGMLAREVLDAWTTALVEEDHWGADRRRSSDFERMKVFECAATLVHRSSTIDNAAVLPRECSADSPQFWAWQFGYFVAKYAMAAGLPGRARALLAYHAFSLTRSMKEKYPDGNIPHRVLDAASGMGAAAALIAEYDPGRDWAALREFCIGCWWEADSFSELDVCDIGPYTDLFWAMRIGLADGILENSANMVTLQPTGIAVSDTAGDVFVDLSTSGSMTNTLALDALSIMARDIPTIKDMLTNLSLHNLRQEQVMAARLPPSKKEIYDSLRERLAAVWDRLPKKVVDRLTKAERLYKSELDDDDAKVHFAKAVEAALDDCFVSPLVEFTKRHGGRINVPFFPPRGSQRNGVGQLRKISLRDWIEVFDVLDTSRNDLLSLGTSDLQQFLNEHFGGSKWPDLHPLAESLRKVQSYRGGSAHYQPAETRLEQEVGELEELRKLILGIGTLEVGTQSVIEQMYKLLTPRRPS